MNDAFALVIIALVCTAAGFTFGMLLANTRSNKNRQTPSAPKRTSNIAEVVTVVQDRKTGNIYPEINGKVVRYPADMTATQRERLAAQVGVLQEWLQASGGAKLPSKTPVEKVAAGETAAYAAPSAAEAPPPGIPSIPKPGGDDASMLPKTPPQPARISPVDMMARALQAEVRNPSPVEKSIAAQIDEILQDKLSGSLLAGRGIRLMELPTKGLVVLVGLDQYAGVDEVPDPEIKSLIRASVAEWERRTSEA